jgi:glycosyltransferase involved in cell wall biosynthesis
MWCDDLIFTATKRSLPIDSSKVRVVGHGIDTITFRPDERRMPKRRLLYVGRIAPIKRLDALVRALSVCNERYGVRYQLDLIGPGRQQSIDAVLELADSLGVGESVSYLGPRQHAELPELMSHYWAMANFSRTALDKSALEAMACGLPVVTTNNATLEALPPGLRTLLGAEEGDVEGEAALIHRVLSLQEEDYASVGRAVRNVVVANHGLDRFFSKILALIDANDRLPPGRRRKREANATDADIIPRSDIGSVVKRHDGS